MIWTFLLSLFTSAMSATPCSIGQSSSGSCKNSGPLNHLSCTSSVEIPLVKSSATFSKVGQCDQLSGEELDRISAARQDTKGLKLRVSPLIQAWATWLSDK